MMKPLYINGKFLAQRTTGVQRFAHGVVSALDRRLQAQQADREVILLAPPNSAQLEDLRAIRQHQVGWENCSPTVWEQIVLPWSARGGTLLCLSGSAPFFARQCIPTIHDAAVFLHPQAYSRSFVAWYRLLFRHLALSAPVILTVSRSSAADLSAYLPNATFRVVSNSAEHITSVVPDSSILQALRLNAGGYLLAVGSLNPTKNFVKLVNAYAKSMLSSRIPLVIVGAVNADVFRGGESIFDHANVRWAGRVSDAQLRALYEHAATFVFPSVYEGFGIPPLEAMHCGCPVIASSASSVPEVCGDAASYIDPMDGEAMMATVETLLTDDSRRQELIKKGYLRSQAFSWDRSAESLLSVLGICERPDVVELEAT